MKYVLLFCGTQEAQREWEQTTQEARNDQYRQVGQWFQENAAKIGHGHQLQGPHTATTVRHQGSGKEPIVRDGPFIEGNEVIGGYVEITVDDLDEALRLAKSWPAGGVVEIRPTLD
ncbi:MAG TPA: YciI family protein [Ktedonobacterales bacterium]